MERREFIKSAAALSLIPFIGNGKTPAVVEEPLGSTYNPIRLMLTPGSIDSYAFVSNATERYLQICSTNKTAVDAFCKDLKKSPLIGSTVKPLKEVEINSYLYDKHGSLLNFLLVSGKIYDFVEWEEIYHKSTRKAVYLIKLKFPPEKRLQVVSPRTIEAMPIYGFRYNSEIKMMKLHFKYETIDETNEAFEQMHYNGIISSKPERLGFVEYPFCSFDTWNMKIKSWDFHSQKSFTLNYFGV